ncbi:MAG TPA: fumarylacetoacetate hydrolase family protein [Aestuariivirga sp.]
MSYVIAPPKQASMPVKGTHLRFPVRRIYCVGRNYNDHVVEMGGIPGREPPFFFQKPADTLLLDRNFPYPPASQDVHHEVELVVALHSGGRNIAVPDATQHIYGYAVGIDMTRRDLQGEAKKAGRPWEVAKAFDHSAPVGEITPKADIGLLERASISLHVNGAQRQCSDISAMIWRVPEIINELSKLFELHAGDMIFTGTPSGVGPIQPGDEIRAAIERVGELTLRVYKPS